MTMKKINLVAVYGSLRTGLQNHAMMNTAEYLGEFDTEPIFDLYSVSYYPGLKENGSTSIKMEVYKVDDSLMSRLNNLEGYQESRDESENHYNRKIIDSPYGLVYTYIYNGYVDSKAKVESGDWVEYKSTVSKIYKEQEKITTKHGME